MQNQTQDQSEAVNAAIVAVKGQEPGTALAVKFTGPKPMQEKGEDGIRDTILELLDKPGAHLSDDALIDAVMNQWRCAPSADEMLDVVLDALDALVDEKQLARVVTCVVLTDLPAPTAVEGAHQDGGLTLDAVREGIVDALPDWPGASEDEGRLFGRLNHELNCDACAHHPESLDAFGKLFFGAVDALVDEGVIARVVTYVRLPGRPPVEEPVEEDQ
jgi:hypothetical protein